MLLTTALAFALFAAPALTRPANEPSKNWVFVCKDANYKSCQTMYYTTVIQNDECNDLEGYRKSVSSYKTNNLCCVFYEDLQCKQRYVPCALGFPTILLTSSSLWKGDNKGETFVGWENNDKASAYRCNFGCAGL